MEGNRKARRKLAKISQNDDRYIAQLAKARAIEERTQDLVDDNLALATDYTLSAAILAIDKVFGHSWNQTLYDWLLDEFRNIYTELITSADPESYLSMAERVCGQELHFEFLHDDWDFREIGSPIEMYVNGVWRKGKVIENALSNDDSVVTMITKQGDIIWRDVGSGMFRKPSTA